MKRGINKKTTSKQRLKFTPLEFETIPRRKLIKILRLLKFTPLEFETGQKQANLNDKFQLEFTPLEFETNLVLMRCLKTLIRIYSVGV